MIPTLYNATLSLLLLPLIRYHTKKMENNGEIATGVTNSIFIPMSNVCVCLFINKKTCY